MTYEPLPMYSLIEGRMVRDQEGGCLVDTHDLAEREQSQAARIAELEAAIAGAQDLAVQVGLLRAEVEKARRYRDISRKEAVQHHDRAEAAEARGREQGLREAAAIVLDWQGRVAIGTVHGNAAHDEALARIQDAILALIPGKETP